MGGSARGDAIIAHVAGAVPTSAATADAVCTATTITPALTSCTLHSSAPTLTFIHLSLSSPLTFTLALIHQAPLSLVLVPLFVCQCALMLCGSSLIVPVYKSKISCHNTLFALTFGI